MITALRFTCVSIQTRGSTMGLKEKVTRDIEMLDLLSCEGIELCSDGNGKVWINLDGRCIIRIGKADLVTVEMKRGGRR